MYGLWSNFAYGRKNNIIVTSAENLIDIVHGKDWESFKIKMWSTFPLEVKL